MMTVLGILVFLAAFGTAAAAIAVSIVPQWRRIVHLATGNVEQPFASTGGAFTYADRRSAIRCGSSAPLPASQFRAAA